MYNLLCKYTTSSQISLTTLTHENAFWYTTVDRNYEHSTNTQSEASATRVSYVHSLTRILSLLLHVTSTIIRIWWDLLITSNYKLLIESNQYWRRSFGRRRVSCAYLCCMCVFLEYPAVPCKLVSCGHEAQCSAARTLMKRCQLMSNDVERAFVARRLSMHWQVYMPVSVPVSVPVPGRPRPSPSFSSVAGTDRSALLGAPRLVLLALRSPANTHTHTHTRTRAHSTSVGVTLPSRSFKPSPRTPSSHLQKTECVSLCLWLSLCLAAADFGFNHEEHCSQQFSEILIWIVRIPY